jgi:hypothetical protein
MPNKQRKKITNEQELEEYAENEKEYEDLDTLSFIYTKAQDNTQFSETMNILKCI